MTVGSGMIPITEWDRTKIKPQTREEQLERLQRWQEASDQLEKTCKELGIPVPILVM